MSKQEGEKTPEEHASALFETYPMSPRARAELKADTSDELASALEVLWTSLAKREVMEQSARRGDSPELRGDLGDDSALVARVERAYAGLKSVQRAVVRQKHPEFSGALDSLLPRAQVREELEKHASLPAPPPPVRRIGTSPSAADIQRLT